MNTWNRNAVETRFNVSRETLDKFDIYVNLLQKWQSKVNLIGPSTIEDIWGRHIADSLQLLKFMPADMKSYIDLGSGAGIPGFVLAIYYNDPAINFHLIESNHKKCAFLQTASAHCSIETIIHEDRIENLCIDNSLKADVITARALAPLSKLIEFCSPFMWKKTVLLLQKGKDVKRELTNSSIYLNMDVDIEPSEVDADSSILIIRSK
ncbi:MAG: 16S rRNA (guanine(527)-N(7))-methyltransferase RsmG [Alphaproteobacteria bacterium]|jgi:16S rRNA (guanine527-N7)-methyltransferase